MHSLYWLKYLSHTNIYEEGYVGITMNPDERWRQHQNNKNNPIVRNAIKKGGVVMEIIRDNLTEEEAYLLEEEYRSKENIGWNIAKGGSKPPSQLGKKFPGRIKSDESKIHHSELMRGKYSRGEIVVWNKDKEGIMEGKGTKPCEYKGIQFNSRTEAAEHFGVDVSAVSQYVKRDGCNRRNRKINYKGKEYENARECARITGASYSGIISWVNRHSKEQGGV